LRALAQSRLELTVPAAIGGTVVAFALGSSSVETLNEFGKPLRWGALFVLFGLAAVSAARSRKRISVPTPLALAVAFFLVLVLVSASWSVDPRLSFARGASFAILFAVAALLAYTAGGRRGEIERVLAGLLAGAGAVAVGGVLLLAVDPGGAIEDATVDLPSRYKGLGENPNTASLLFALALPIAGWFALRPASRASRAAAFAAVLLFSGSIAASVSRGALVAGFAGLLLVAALAPPRARTRAAAVTGALALLGATLAAQLIPQPLAAPAATAAPPAPSESQPRYVDAQAVAPLEFDIGPDRSERRSFLGSGGRIQAWRGALDRAGDRPLLGYGFGTEQKVFVDRYSTFAGDLPENSYIGLGLQLGAVGIVSFLLLVGLLVVTAARALHRPEVVVCLGVIVAGLLLAVVQSYVYAVGNIGTATLWICALLALPVVGLGPRE
jgi:O-Antigen ligase